MLPFRQSRKYGKLGNLPGLHTCFTALASDPASATKLKFFEERVKTWVSEIIAGHDGLSVQAHILSQRVDNLVSGLNENRPPAEL